MTTHRGVERSRQLLKRSDEIMIAGCQSHKRSQKMLDRGAPVFCERAEGARFWDADGNEYLDFLLGYGPVLLGYNDPAVNAAISRQIQNGTIFTVAHVKEVALAERLIGLIPSAEMIGFLIGGSAATSGAIRLARAHTGRDTVIRCGYHGWHDWCSPVANGIPASERALVLDFPYGDLTVLEDRFKSHDGQVACVIVETVQADGPPQGFLQGCVDLAHRYGALCIFDEIKVGFRIAYGGAGEYYGVQPDLSTFGKACCNGYPGSFVTGRRDILASEACRGAWLGATFHCDLPSLVAIDTVIDEMQRRDGIACLWKTGRRLIDGINRVCEEGGLGYRLGGLAPMPQPKIAEGEWDRCVKMMQGCLRRGLYLQLGHPMFVCLAHTEADIDYTVNAVAESIAEIK